MTDAELAKMQMLLRDRTAHIDVDDYMRMARELLEDVHRQRHLVKTSDWPSGRRTA